MQTLYVMYDARCGLCTEIRDWLRNQPSYVNLEVLASNSEWVQKKFPGLPADELAVVSESGHVWLGNNAFIMCLWALRAYRVWAKRLCSPLLRPLARHAFEAVSHNRHSFSALFRLKSEAEIQR